MTNHVLATGLLSDARSFCKYVNANREYLNIHPAWIASRDCLYQQLVDVMNSTEYKIAVSVYPQFNSPGSLSV